MDNGSGEGDDQLVELGQAIKAELASAQRSQQWLADALPIDNGQLSRILNGRSPKLALGMVQRIEQLLGVRPGHLLRAAGYVDLDGLTTRDVIASAPELTPADREAMLRLYDAWAVSDDSSAGISAAGSSSAPTPPRRRRT